MAKATLTKATGTKPARKSAKATAKQMKVTWMLPVNPQVSRLSKEQLVQFGKAGEQASIAAGLELLRRATNKLARKAAAA